MTVFELIRALSEANPDDEVFILRGNWHATKIVTVAPDGTGATDRHETKYREGVYITGEES